MNQAGQRDAAVRLLPHQTAFVKTFFDPASGRVILLQGDVGLGKTAALIALLSRLLQERVTARVLVLAPAALWSQFMQQLSDASIPSLLVDRYQFREMLDSTAEGEFWPRGTVSVLSMDFAKLPDILDRLAEARWDLVIVDEVHRSLTGARAEALRRVMESAERIVLATAFELPVTDKLFDSVSTVVEWRRNMIVNHDGTLLDTLPRPLLHEIFYSLSPRELSLLNTLGDLWEPRKAATTHRNVTANLVLRCFQSSPAALEPSLQRLAEGLRAQSGLDDPLGESEDELPEGESDVRTDRSSAGNVAEIATRALLQMEEIGGDSKLRAFGVLLTQLNEAEMSSRRICVLTNYVGTLYYLAAEIEDRGNACHPLHGRQGAAERQDALTQFLGAGGISVATAAVMVEGFDLPAVTDLVLYDIPRSKVALQGILGRFDRFGRQTRLNVYVLTPSNVADSSTSEPLGLLRELLETSQKVQPPR